MHIYPINGACHRVKPDATAFAYRDAQFATVIAGMWPEPADNAKNIRWVKDYYAALQPHSMAGGYVNFMADDDQGRVHDNYKGNYDRLAQIKKKYDPAQPVPPQPEHQAGGSLSEGRRAPPAPGAAEGAVPGRARRGRRHAAGRGTPRRRRDLPRRHRARAR